MRTNSLAIAFAATLIACSGHDDPAPTGDQTAAVVAPTQPTDPATPAATAKDDATPATPPADKKTEAPPAKTDAPTADDGAFAALAQKLNDCLSACKDATCGSACLSDFQANVPERPDAPSTTAMCCAGTAFFVCHAADGGEATCDAKNPGPHCQPVPAMDVICKKGP
jgi:hypothetical protein